MPRHISPTELHQDLRRGRALVILDVREPEEVAIARFPNAQHIPMGDVPERVHELDPDAEIVVVCHHGVRSAHVAAFLAERGFGHILNLTGGIDAWSRTVDPTVPRY
jgi:rhodanese-related sulfurtransferase